MADDMRDMGYGLARLLKIGGELRSVSSQLSVVIEERDRLRIERDEAIQRGGEWARKATEEAECNKPLRDKLAAAEADTERLDWLVINGASVATNTDGDEYWVWVPEDLTREFPQRRCPRAAIDAAKKATP